MVPLMEQMRCLEAGVDRYCENIVHDELAHDVACWSISCKHPRRFEHSHGHGMLHDMQLLIRNMSRVHSRSRSNIDAGKVRIQGQGKAEPSPSRTFNLELAEMYSGGTFMSRGEGPDMGTGGRTSSKGKKKCL